MVNLREQKSDQQSSEGVTERHTQRIPTVGGQKRRRPAWAEWNFIAPKVRPSKPELCAECGIVAIPYAHQGKLKFCSFDHGKTYLRKHRPSREESPKITEPTED